MRVSIMSQYQRIPVTLFQQKITRFECAEINKATVIDVSIMPLNGGDDVTFIAEPRPMGLFSKEQFFCQGLR